MTMLEPFAPIDECECGHFIDRHTPFVYWVGCPIQLKCQVYGC